MPWWDSVVMELTLAIMNLPFVQMDLRRRPAEIVLCSDASEYGGGVCVSKCLSDDGVALLSRFALQSQSGPRSAWGLIEFFGGISGGRRACDMAGLELGAHAVCEIKESAISVVKFNYPRTLLWGDVLDVWDDQLHSFMKRGTRVRKVLCFVGSPCQAATAANVAAKGIEDSRTQILCRALQLRDRYFKRLQP